MKELELGNFAEAKAQFLAVHKLYPNARTHRALGMVEYELKNYPESIAQLEQALSSRVRPLEGRLREDTEKLLVQARSYVGRVTLDVRPDPATLLVDGVPAPPATRTLLLTLGEHALEFTAPGRVSEKRRMYIQGGDETQLHVVLPPEVTHTEPEVTRTERQAVRCARTRGFGPQSAWPWPGTAVGLALGLQKEPKEDIVGGSPEINNGGAVQTLWEGAMSPEKAAPRRSRESRG